MCNLAGYTGVRRAAPVLIDMIRRQEGLCCGYYTGIATVYEGKIFSAKVVGGLDRLLSETDALDLPGNTGIIHSRTNSGGGVEWGHPFLSSDGRIASVLNGISGKLCPKDVRDRAAQSLSEDGFVYRTRTEGAIGPYPVLADGSGVHCSEVRTFLLERNYLKTKDPSEAARLTCRELPMEVIALSLFADEPGTIFASRRNFPLTVGCTKDSTYLASAALAFPPDEDFLSISPMPVMTAGEFRADSCRYRPLYPAQLPVKEIDAELLARAKETIFRILDERNNAPVSLLDIEKDIIALFPEDMLSQEWMLIYETIRPLLKSGGLVISEKITEGAFPGIEARVQMIAKATNQGRIHE